MLATATPATDQPITIPAIVSMPQMAPELALVQFQQRTLEQSSRLHKSQDRTFITAELPDTKQRGEYELVRTFTANPRSLQYSTVKFEGDGFVKTTVITKVLQSEVEHVQKDDAARTAITEANYKFSYKGTEMVNGRLTHVYQIKPRKKRPGLVKGKIYVDAYTASLRRMEGTLAKSPSFFVKNVEFVQDFDDVDGFTVPTTLRSIAKARIIGKAIVNVVHKAYTVSAGATSNAAQSLLGNPQAQ